MHHLIISGHLKSILIEVQVKLEDTKGVIRICNLKDNQYSGIRKKDKKINNV